MEDALRLIGESLWEGRPVPTAESAVEDVDVSTLDAGHVLPNMHEPASRGIWFAMGFSLIVRS